MRETLVRIFGLASLAFTFQYLIVRELKLNGVQTCCSLDAAHGTSNKKRKYHQTGGGPTKQETTSNQESRDQPDQLVSTSSRLPDYDKYLRIYYKFSLYYYSFTTLKYLAICLLRWDHLRKQYGYVGCYLVGRLMVNGRLAGLINYFSLFAALYLLIWRLLMVKFPQNHRLYCHEFLMYTMDELEGHEHRAAPNRQVVMANQAGSFGQDWQYESILHTKSSPEGQQQQVAWLRLNRTANSWRAITRTFATYWLYSLFFLALAVPVFLSMILPLWLTRRGFELSYDECCWWISNGGNQTAAYSHICQLNPADPIKPKAFLPWRHLTQINVYHCVRLLADLFDCLMFYFESASFFMANTANSLLISNDLCHYGRQLCGQLHQLNLDLRKLPDQSRATFRYRSNVDRLESRIHAIQMMLADYFKLINSYSQFVSTSSLWCIISWLTLAAMIFGTLFVPGSEKPKLEWYLLHLYRTFYSVMDLGSFARVRAASARIYPLVASSACLDPDNFERKYRWLSILKHYSPRPMHSLTILGSIELSWLFMLKLLTWLISSLVIAGTLMEVG